MAFGEGLVEPRHTWGPDTQAALPKTMAVLQEIFVQSDYQSRLLSPSWCRRISLPPPLPPPVLGGMARANGLSAEQVWDSLVTLNRSAPDQEPAYDPAQQVLDLYRSLRSLDTAGLVRTAEEVLKRQGFAQQKRQEIKALKQQAQAANQAGDPTAAQQFKRQAKEQRQALLAVTEARAETPEHAQASDIMNMMRMGGQRRNIARQPTLRALYLPAPAPPEHLLRTFGQSDRVIPDGSHQQAACRRRCS